jgi:hypothetical protein
MRERGRSLSHRSAVFAGCVRDCERHLPGVLANLEALSGLFARSAFVLVENDSKDRTRSVLQHWGRGREGIYLATLEGLDAQLPPRTVRLAAARNHYLDVIRRSELRTFDYLFVMDLDNVCEDPIDVAAVARAMAFLEEDASRAGVFANQHGPYYDLWALRHPDLCPGDIWFDILHYAERHGVSDDEAYEQVFRPRVFSLPATAAPVKVESCFGGLGIYKMQAMLGAVYCGEATASIRQRFGPPRSITIQACEHVEFNRRIGANGRRLFILPYLINGTTRTMDYPPSDCRTIIINAPDMLRPSHSATPAPVRRTEATTRKINALHVDSSP